MPGGMASFFLTFMHAHGYIYYGLDVGTTLDLGHSLLGDRNLQKMGQFLTHYANRPLQTLVLKDNAMAGNGCTSIMRAITTSLSSSSLSPPSTLQDVPFKSLMCLDLSHNAIGKAGAAAIGDALAVSTCGIQSLILENNKLGTHVGTLLLTKLAANTSLTSLNVSRNELGCGAAMALMLKRHCRLKVLDTSWNVLRGDSALAIAESMGENNSLERLNVAYNSFGEAGVMSLAKALEKNASLQWLDMTRNNIGPVSEDNGKVFMMLLASNTTLATCVLDGNPVGSATELLWRKWSEENAMWNERQPGEHTVRVVLHLNGCNLTSMSTFVFQLPRAADDSETGSRSPQ
jgi:hypothetical protein